MLRLVSFWKFWFAFSGKNVEISLQDVLIDKLDEVSALLNYILIIYFLFAAIHHQNRPRLSLSDLVAQSAE